MGPAKPCRGPPSRPSIIGPAGDLLAPRSAQRRSMGEFRFAPAPMRPAIPTISPRLTSRSTPPWMTLAIGMQRVGRRTKPSHFEDSFPPIFGSPAWGSGARGSRSTIFRMMRSSSHRANVGSRGTSTVRPSRSTVMRSATLEDLVELVRRSGWRRMPWRAKIR